MQRYANRILAIVLAACAGFALSYAIAAPAPAANTFDYLPVVANQAGPTPTPAPSTLTLLVDTDAGIVTAAVIPTTNRVILAYTDRRDGNRLKVVEDIGSTVKPVNDPNLAKLVLASIDPAPTFNYPGDKQGFGMPVFVNGRMRIYATSRAQGDPQGPFGIWRLDMPIPAP